MNNRQVTAQGSPSPKSKFSPIHHSKSLHHSPSHNDPQSTKSSPIKILLQNNIQLNTGKQGQRSQQEVEIITMLLRESNIVHELELDLSDGTLCRELSNGVVLIYCQGPHIMEINDNQLHIFLEGQGFEYMQNSFGSQEGHKHRLYQDHEYIMLRKIGSNQHFLSLQEHAPRYHIAQKKYQLMVDQNTLIGKFSQDVFLRVLLPRIQERQKGIVASLRKVQILSGLPSSFFHELSKFVSEENHPAGKKVLSREDKPRSVYFLRNGTAELRLFSQPSRAPLSSTPNYYITSQRPYTLISLAANDCFGMEWSQDGQREVICISECIFLKIDKRLLAIIITSFDLQFQQKNKLWSEVNINSQIKGQNYCSPEKELLLKNVERIRTSERKIRDIKLKYLSVKGKKESSPIIRQESFKEPIREVHEENQGDINGEDRRRMSRTTQGRFRSSKSFFKLIGSPGEEERKYDALRKKLQEQRQGHTNERLNQIQILALDSEEPLSSHKLLSSKAFDYKEHLELQKSHRSTSRSEKYQSNNKFVPRLQVKSSLQMGSGKADSKKIGDFLDKKIKNQIVRKAERVLSINHHAKITENNNLKRLFAPATLRTIHGFSEADKKSIAEDIVQKMSNLRQNPLLLQIESERRKVQRQLKLSARKAKAKTNEGISPAKKYKQEDQLILIRNNQT